MIQFATIRSLRSADDSLLLKRTTPLPDYVLSGIGHLHALPLRPQAAATVSQFTFLLLYLVSGAFAPVDDLPVLLTHASYPLLPYHSFQLMLDGADSVTQLGHALALALFVLIPFSVGLPLDKHQELA